MPMTEQRIILQLKRFVVIASLLTCITGVIVLLGWVFHVALLKSVLPGLATMKANTAFCFVLSGGALWFYQKKQPRLMLILAGIILVISALTLSQYLFGWNLKIDQLIFADSDTAPHKFPGRMSPLTAINFVLISFSLLTMPRSILVSQLFAMAVGGFALFGLLGYMYDADALYAMSPYRNMAFHTTLLFFLISVASIRSNPGVGIGRLYIDTGPAGYIARRTFPALLIAFLFLGGLNILAQSVNAYDEVIGLMLINIINVYVFVGIVAWSIAAIYKYDLKRRHAEAELQRTHRAYKTLSNCNQILIRANKEHGLLQRVCQEIIETGEYMYAWVALGEPRTVAAQAGFIDPTLTTFPGIQAMIAQAAYQPQIKTHLLDDPEWQAAAAKYSYQSVMVLPIIYHGYGWGTLQVYSSEVDGFTEKEVDLLDELAGDLGYGIVTLRDRAALVQAEEHFRLMFVHNMDIMMIVDAQNGAILQVNPLVKAILGYTPESLQGKHFSILFPDYADFLIEYVQGNDAVMEAQPFAHQDGSIRYMDVTATMIPWSQGKAILATLRDLTERYQAQEALTQAEVMRATATQELELAKLKERFIATVSHDFRTPLAVILSSSSMLEGYFDQLPADRRLKHLQKISDNVGRMNDMLDDVLLFSKMRDGRAEFAPVQINIGTFCQGLLEEIQAIAPDSCHLTFSCGDKVNEALWDEKLMRRVLMNLLNNAVKYSPNGGQIELAITCEQDELVIRVSDQGIGIPEKDRLRLFEPFYRASNVDKIKGTGLGLAIVGESVQIHGGKIEVISGDKQGTVFVIRLPRQQVAKAVD